MDAPILAIDIVIELALDHADHDFVADQAALVHNLLCRAPERRLLCDLRTQHIASCLATSITKP
jgi:hypothetical protein